MGKISSALNKSKALLVGLGVVGLGVIEASANIAFDKATNTFTGDIDLSPFYSGVTIALSVMGVTIAVGLAWKFMSKSH